VIESGFYYDFKHDRRSRRRISSASRRDARDRRANFRSSVARSPSEADRVLRELGEHYKVEIIEGIPDDRVSLYTQGDFTDLCAGRTCRRPDG
jgi:threonyl-tRNA synthetase